MKRIRCESFLFSLIRLLSAHKCVVGQIVTRCVINNPLVKKKFSCRERQMKLEKVRATQQEIEEFKKQQAEWRCLEQERMEAENRRIMEFMNLKELDEESRTAKIREREEAMGRIHKMVETIF